MEDPVVDTLITATKIDEGQKLEESTLSGTFKDALEEPVDGALTWTDPSTVASETGEFGWTFTPTDLEAYNVTTGTVNVEVTPAPVLPTDPVVDTAVSATRVKEKETLAESVLTGTFKNAEGEPIEGVLEWATPSTVVIATDSYDWTFTPTDTGLYNATTGKVEVEAEAELKNRRKKTMRYGLKEVADVIFFDLKSNRPVLIFDTLKVSNIENASESTEASGGKGNSPLVSWDYGRTATLTMQDALLSDNSLAMLAGTEVEDAQAKGVKVTRHEIIVAGVDGAIELSHEANGDTVNAYKNEGGTLGEEVDYTGTGSDFTTVDGAVEGDKIAVFYESLAEEGATLITFSSDKFPAIYKVVGTSLVRDEDGMDHPFQFVIPRAKLQSGFTFTMDPENVSTFDFNLQVLVEQGTRKLYDIIRL